jgi:peptidyl-dipeptidase Dcp
MCQAIFDCANKLFGLRFVYRDDLPVYHPDVKAYEVFRTADDGGDQPDVFVGIFLSGEFNKDFFRGAT